MRAAFLLLLVAALRLDAQVVERPVAFDSAGKVRSLTPSLVARFGLRPPAWPVSADFTQARLFAVSTGGSVLVAERRTGEMERYLLADDQVNALRAAVDSAMSQSGALVGEDRPDLISEPARGAFLRNQMILAAALYGPLLASLTDDVKTGTALYLISVGGSYFVLNNISKNTAITRAQNDLATDGAVRGAGTAVGLLRAFGGPDVNDKAYSAAALSGAIFGSLTGYAYGRRLTDSEAQSAIKGSTFAAATAFGIAGASSDLDGESAERFVAGSMVASGIIGYLVGPRYPRVASYTVTSGDVRLLPIGALLGALVGVTPFVDQNNDRLAFGAATLGGWAGILAADRAWARPFDHGTSDVTQVWLGTIAGALLGGGLIVLTETDNAVPALAMVTGGGLLGAIAGHHLADPPRAQPRRASLAPDLRSRGGRLAISLDPTALAFSAARVPGRHALISLRF